MELERALNILADCHTRDDDRVGFVVEQVPSLFWHSQSEYIEAWETVRRAVHRMVDPASAKTGE